MSRAGSEYKLEQFAHGLAMGMTPVEAAKHAGYPDGSSFAANARKRAQREDVKKRVRELKAPALKKVAEKIEINVEYLAGYLYGVIEAAKRLTPFAEVSEGLSAMDKAAKLLGLYAPEKRELSGEIVERIENIIVHPPPHAEDPDRGGVRTAADAGEI